MLKTLPSLLKYDLDVT